MSAQLAGAKRPRLPSSNVVASEASRSLNREIVTLSPPAIVALVAARAADFNDVNCATALARLCRFQAGAASTRSAVGSLMLRTAETVSGASNGKTLTSIAHSLGVMGQAAEHLESSARVALSAVVPAACAALAAGDAGAPGALATVLWACGTLRWVPPDLATCTGLFAATASAASHMSAAELSNAAWGAARAGVRSPALMASLGVAATSLAKGGAFTAQGLASTAWAWAKLRLRPPVALHDAALAMLQPRKGAAAVPLPPPPLERDPQALAMVAWAWARWPSAPLNEAISATVRRALAATPLTFPPQSCATLLQALSGGRAEGAGVEGWASLSAPGVDAATLRALAAASVDALLRAGDGMSAGDLGVTAAAIARGVVQPAPGDAPALLAALVAAVARHVGAMDWRGVAAAEMALRSLAAAGGAREAPVTAGATAAAAHAYSAKLGRGTARAMRQLAARAGEACAAASAGSSAAAASASALFERTLAAAQHDESSRSQWAAALRGGSDVLLAGADPGGTLGDALRLAGSRVQRWRRFAASDEPHASSDELLASAWPEGPAGSPRGFAASVLRVPPSAEAAAFAADGIASVLAAGGTLVLLGLVDEGATEAALRGALGGAFDSLTLLNATSDGTATVFCARRTAAPPVRGMADLWRTDVALEIASPALPCSVFPGLFAGGTLDVMTSALLACLPPLPGRARVLDFGCGSGTLAAALALREPTLRLTLLDADALAIAAATTTMRSVADAVAGGAAAAPAPPAAKLILSDAFSALPPSRRFDLIVSNPPVHSGAHDDFRILTRLLAEAPRRLRSGGSLWLVAQVQVPVGRLAASVGGWHRVRPVPLSSGRFIAWHAQLTEE